MDLKTTISGIIAGAAQILKIFNINVDPIILDAISAVAIVIMGYFAKDKKASPPTGGA